LQYNKLAYEFRTARKQGPDPLPAHGWEPKRGRALGLGIQMLQKPDMTLTKPTFPAPDHDHGRCTADAMAHAEEVCARRTQKFTPIRRQVLQALLSSHRPLGAYEVIDELAKSMPRPAPITVYRALDFLMENGLVHRIESRNAFLACAHDHDETSMVAFLICDHCGSVGEIPAAPVAQSLNAAARASGFAPKLSVVEIAGTCAHCQK
jgi:Fur family transcriptional regulator, zinc uptake regulator